MQISLGVRFCKAFISKDYAFDSCELRNDKILNIHQKLNSLKKSLDLSFIPILERRRLSEASKIAFGLIGDSPLCVPIVFSSQKGEINRCFGMLQDLALHNLASPTAFSLSVLNATPALLAIAHKNHSEILAISAKDSLEYGLINAYMLLCELSQDSSESSAKPKDCLVISYDEKLDSKEISAIMACVSLEKNLPQIHIKSHESQCNDSAMTSNLSFLFAVAGAIPRYKNGDFALDLSDFLKGFSIESL